MITAQHMSAYSQRLRESHNEREKRSLLLGINPHHEYPIVLDAELLEEHMHILGASGSGKTSLGLIPLIKNLIRNGENCIVLDLKGDNAMFQTAKQEAETAGREFKWFTNRPNHSTYIFNPFLQEPFESMTISDVTGFFISSLNLHHGSDYGRAYFGLMARSLLQESLRMSVGQSGNRARLQSRAPKPVESFEELCEIVHELTNSNDEYRNASHLVHVIRNLADFRQLNLNPALVRDEDGRTAVEHAIHMPDVISKKQVVYFYLTPAHDEVTVCEMARLAIFATLNAALDHQTRTGKAARVVLVCDEAQLVIAKNISQVLAQARSAGVGMVLCHQTLSQLNPPGGADLRDIVLNCTVAKQFWSARDPESKEYISKISGDVGYYSASWNQTKRRVLGGEIGRRFAAASVEDPLFISINEQEGPRLTSQDIENYSRHPNMSIVSIHRNHGYSCYDGAFPVFTPWSTSKETYQAFAATPWPEPSSKTIVVEPDWKRSTNHEDDSEQAFEEGGGVQEDFNTLFDEFTQPQ